MGGGAGGAPKLLDIQMPLGDGELGTELGPGAEEPETGEYVCGVVGRGWMVDMGNPA